jgi:cytochrome c oxidase cbb3-type subunit 3/ubiquinol-cytochrome c reductase cytochrome c subunit
VSGALLLSAAFAAILGCSRIPGRPGPGPDVIRPNEVLAFSTLYKDNCAACHGETGKNGAAISLANPVYLAVAGEDNIGTTIANGVSGGLMPPFDESSGGTLTDAQIDALAKGLIKQWGKPNLLDGQNAPPYEATLTGDVERGRQAFASFCAQCHGPAGKGSLGDPKSGAGKLGSLVDPSYLALISDQNLRSITIAGRPDQGMPDWRSDSTQPLTDQQITDIITWLASNRTANPGQPYRTRP